MSALDEMEERNKHEAYQRGYEAGKASERGNDQHQAPSKKRRDAWIWTTCKGCKFKKQCDFLQIYLPPCGRDYDEELSLEHDALIATQATAAENKRVLDSVKDAIDRYMVNDPKARGHASIHKSIWGIIESLRLAQPDPTEREPE